MTKVRTAESILIDKMGIRRDTIILPEPIHSATVEAVSDTVKDGRERAIGFRYLMGNWRSAGKIVGTGHKINSDGSLESAEITRGLISINFRPRIFMHTHPRPDRAFMAEWVRLKPGASKLGDNSIKHLTDQHMQFEEGTYMLPSNADVQAARFRSLGSRGNIIASDGGIFMYVPNEAEMDESGGVQDARLTEYREIQKRAFFEGRSEEDLTSFILSSAVKALSPEYTCYFNNDPENPNLSLVS